MWKKPVVKTGNNRHGKNLVAKMAKTTKAKNISMTNITCKINLKPIHDHSYLKKIVYLECL